MNPYLTVSINTSNYYLTITQHFGLSKQNQKHAGNE